MSLNTYPQFPLLVMERKVATTRTKKILCVTDEHTDLSELPIEVPPWCEVVTVDVSQMEATIGALLCQLVQT